MSAFARWTFPLGLGAPDGTGSAPTSPRIGDAPETRCDVGLAAMRATSRTPTR